MLEELSHPGKKLKAEEKAEVDSQALYEKVVEIFCSGNNEVVWGLGFLNTTGVTHKEMSFPHFPHRSVGSTNTIRSLVL